MKGCEKSRNYWRCRQAPPSKFDPKSFRTVSAKGGVKLVIGCPKGKFRKGKCAVGTRIQSKLVPIKK